MTNEIMVQPDLQDREIPTAVGMASSIADSHEALFPAQDSESFRNRPGSERWDKEERPFGRRSQPSGFVCTDRSRS